MATGDAFKAAVTKAGLDAAKESAVALTAALRAAEEAAAALNKRGPMTPQDAAASEVRRLGREARQAASEFKALEAAQARQAAAGARAGAAAEKTAARTAAAAEKAFVRARDARTRKGVAAAVREQRAGTDGGGGGKGRGVGGDGGAGTPKDLKYLLKNAGIGKAAMGAMGAAAGLELSKLALGYRGMAQLSAISTRTGYQIRQLFAGVDPSPVVRAYDKFTQLFNKSTATGNAIAGIFGRVFNSLFGGVEKAEPLFFAFAEGMVGGALQIEIAFYKARIALMPMTDAIGDLVGSFDGIDGAANAGGIALVALGAYAAVAAAPFIPLAAAITAVTTALDLFAKLQKQVAGAGGWGSALKEMGSHFVSTDAGREEDIGAKARANYEAHEAQRKAGAAPAAGGAGAGAAGAPTGKAYTDGIAAGVTAGLPGVTAAGKSVAKALDQGTRTQGEIHSPSRVAERTAAEFPAGTVRGVDSGIGDVGDAGKRVASAAVAPGMGGAASGMGTGEILAVLKQIEMNTRARGGGGSDGGLHSIARALGIGLVPQ